MTTTEQAPNTAPAVAEAIPAAMERTVANISGAEFLAERSRRRASTPAARPAQKPQPVEAPSAESNPEAATPAPGTETAPDETNATSTPSEDGAQGTARPTDEPGEELTAAETSAETSEETSEAPEVEPKGIKALQKRVDKLTAQLRDTEARLAQEASKAESRNEKAEIPNEAREGEFGHVPAVQEVNTEIAKWRTAEQWLAENPDGGDILDAKGNVIQSVTPEQARRTRLEADEKLAELRAQRAVLVQQFKAQDASIRSQAEAKATESFTWLQDANNEKRKALDEIVALVPELKRLPAWKLFAAHAIESVTRAQTRTATPPPRAVPPKVAVPNGAAAPRVSPVQKQLAEAEAAFEKSGNGKDFQRVQQLRRELRQSKS